jgi:hypothetical protein
MDRMKVERAVFPEVGLDCSLIAREKTALPRSPGLQGLAGRNVLTASHCTQ